MHDLAKCVVDTWKGTISEHLCELNRCCNLDEDLNFVQGLAMGGVADFKTVEAESTVLVLVGTNIDVTIILVVGRQVQICGTNYFPENRILMQDLRLVKADSVSQNLNCRICAVVIGRHTELSADIVCSRRRRNQVRQKLIVKGSAGTACPCISSTAWCLI